MRRIAIVETWNGEGYSSENKVAEYVWLRNHEGIKKPLERAQELAVERAGGIDKVELMKDGQGYIYDLGNDTGDCGAIHLVEVTPETYGVEILCNINEIRILDKGEYLDQITTALAALMREDDFEDSEVLESLDRQECFVHSGYICDHYDVQLCRLYYNGAEIGEVDPIKEHRELIAAHMSEIKDRLWSINEILDTNNLHLDMHEDNPLRLSIDEAASAASDYSEALRTDRALITQK